MSDPEQPEQEDPAKLFAQAKALQGSGEHGQAVLVLERVVELAGDWESRFRLANSLAIDAQIERAYAVWCEAVDTPEWNPNQVQGELAGQFAEAMRHVSFETTVDADDPKSSYLQAKIAHMFEQPDVVRHALTKTVHRNPNYEDALEWLMQFHLEAESHEEALKLLDPLLLHSPGSPELNYWVGELNYLTQRTAVAIRILSAAVKLDPNRWQAHARLGQIYSAQHRFEEADQAYTTALRLCPDNLSLVMGSLETAKRLYQFDRALQLLEKATTLSPDDAQVQIEYAQLCFQMGALDKAVPGLEMALRESPEDPQLTVSLAKAYHTTGQHDKAVPLFRSALQSQTDAELAFLLSRSLAELSLKPEALEVLRKAVEWAPDRAHYQAMLGKELLALGQQEEALKALAAAATLEPTNAMAQLTVAGLYKKSGRATAAMDAYLVASRLEPERVDVHLQVGVLGLSCDRLDEASFSFKEVLRLSSEPHPMALAGVAQVYQRRGMPDVAVDFYRQALQANPGLAAAAQAVSIIFAKEKDIDGLLAFLRDLLQPLGQRPDEAAALAATFKSYLESKLLLGFSAEVASLMAELFPSPENRAEQARLLLARADQLQSKGEAVRAYAVLNRLHQLQPDLPDLAIRLSAMKAALGSAVEATESAASVSVTMAAESEASTEGLLDSVFAPPGAVPAEADAAEAAPSGTHDSVAALPAEPASPDSEAARGELEPARSDDPAMAFFGSRSFPIAPLEPAAPASAEAAPEVDGAAPPAADGEQESQGLDAEEFGEEESAEALFGANQRSDNGSELEEAEPAAEGARAEEEVIGIEEPTAAENEAVAEKPALVEAAVTFEEEAVVEEAGAEEAAAVEVETAGAEEAVAVEVETAGAEEAVAVEVETAGAEEAVAVEVETAGAEEAVAVEVEAIGAEEAVAVEAEVCGAEEAVGTEPAVEPSGSGTSTPSDQEWPTIGARVHSQGAAQGDLWERSLRAYLLTGVSNRAIKQPRELDDEGRQELCDIFTETAQHLRDAGWLEQSYAILNTALLYRPHHGKALEDLEETVLEWVDFLVTDESYQQAVMLLESQWERQPSDRLLQRARAVFSQWAVQLRARGDEQGGQALEAHSAARFKYWDQLKAVWALRAEMSEPPEWELF